MEGPLVRAALLCFDSLYLYPHPEPAERSETALRAELHVSGEGFELPREIDEFVPHLGVGRAGLKPQHPEGLSAVRYCRIEGHARVRHWFVEDRTHGR